MVDHIQLSKRRFFGLLPGALAASMTPAFATRIERAAGVEARDRLRDALLSSGEESLADTVSGRIRGFSRGPIRVFKGIPYGAPTSGDNRFRPPQPVAPWTGIRSCLSYGPQCPTLPSTFSAGDEDKFLLYRGYQQTPASEDCLRLNIWAPASRQKKAVMVYMHGGGFVGGCGNDLQSYDGTSLALTQDVVVVTHNHRLNAFGYLNLSGVVDSRYADSANVGLLDLRAVMEWVKDNIAEFGGDPQRVMIFGQSGGGAKVGCLMAMPSAASLFHTAGVQSGSVLRVQEPDVTQEVGRQFIKELGASNKNLSKVAQSSTADIIRAADAAASKVLPPIDPSKIDFKAAIPGWGPTRGNHVLPEHPFYPGAPTVSKSVPMIIGTNFNEFVSAVDNPEAANFSRVHLRARVEQTFGANATAIIDAYSKEYPAASAFELYGAIAASGVRAGAVEQGLQKASLGGGAVYEYIYSWKTPVLGGRPGTFHSAEIAMVFNNALLCDQYTSGSDEALSVAAMMSGAWAALARNGSPQHSGLPNWPAFESSRQLTMLFDAHAKAVSFPETEGLRLTNEARGRVHRS